jgi:membrane dipeptidase
VSPDTPIVDGHVDALLNVRYARDGPRTFASRSDRGHVDLPRLRDGGVAVAFAAAFVPDDAGDDAADTEDGDGVEWADRPPAADPALARRETRAMFDLLDEWAELDGVLKVTDETDLDACLDGDAVGLVGHVEGAAAVRPDLSNLDDFYDRGLRSLGLVWSRPNAFGHGVPFTHDASPDSGPGLTDAGESLVRACESRGVLVDCAHLNAAGIRDVARIADEPFVVSHAGAHAVSPAARNLTDDLLELVADSDGVVGVTLAVPHLRPDGARDPETALSRVADHVEHLLGVTGPRHVALGSDLDGATVPAAVGDAAGLPAVLDALRDRGLEEDTVERIAYRNWARVLRTTID